MRYKDNNKLNRIFNSTLEIATFEGLPETSVSKIAKKANISSSTIYVYFENKEDLLIKLYVHVKKDMSEKIFKDIYNCDTFKKSFTKLLMNYIDYVTKNTNIFLFIEQFNNSPLYKKIPDTYYKDINEKHDNFYQIGRNQNLLKDIDTNFLTVYTYYPLMQFIKDYLSEKIELTSTNVELILQMSWDAIKA